jgi:beta-phosphoglucomutase
MLDALKLRNFFDTFINAGDVAFSKPNPEVFLKCASNLNVSPKEAVVFEDAPKGIEAAKNGGVKAVAVAGFHRPEEFDTLDNLLFAINGYNDEQLEKLFYED